MPRRRKNNAGRRGRGGIPFQFHFVENNTSGGTVNIVTSNFKLPTDRPFRIAHIKLQLAATYDAISDNGQPVLVQVQFRAPDGSQDGRVLYQTMPQLITAGQVITRTYRFPNAGMFLYDPNSIVARVIISESQTLAVSVNTILFVQMAPPHMN